MKADLRFKRSLKRECIGYVERLFVSLVVCLVEKTKKGIFINNKINVVNVLIFGKKTCNVHKNQKLF